MVFMFHIAKFHSFCFNCIHIIYIINVICAILILMIWAISFHVDIFIHMLWCHPCGRFHSWFNSHKFHYSTTGDQNFACYQFHLEHLMQVVHLNQFVKYFGHIFNIDMVQFHICMRFICMISSMRSSISCSSMWLISIMLNASTTSLVLSNLSMS